MMTGLVALLIAFGGQSPAPAPAPEAVALGRQLAESEMLASLLPLIQAKETDEIVAAHPDLSAADQARLRATAARIYAAGRERLLGASGRVYAEQLSVEELRVLVAFHTSPAAQRHRAVTPAAIMASMAAIEGSDFKRDVRAAFCAETRLLCDQDR